VTDNLLLTIPISHYCEKARWALDRAGIGYVERSHVQAIHRFAVRRAGGGSTVPVLCCADGVLADSTDILTWVDAQGQAPPLYPRSPDDSRTVRELERYFDTSLGPQSRCWIYQQLRTRRDLAIDYGCAGVPEWERMTLRIGYPVLFRFLARVLDVTPATGLRCEHEARAVFDFVAERLSDDRRYLCGDAFTAADLTFSALAAPMLMPIEYGVRLPQPDVLPPYMADVVQELREHRAGRHALSMFESERRSPSV
jgi:glutathione S-transferase